MGSQRLVLSFRDYSNRTARHTIPVSDELERDADEIATLKTAFQACSNASLYSITLDKPTNRDNSGDVSINGAFDAYDKVVFAWKVAATGKIIYTAVVDCISEILTDEEIVDKAHELVVLYKNKGLAVLKDRVGNAATKFMGGWRDRSAKSARAIALR